MPQSEGRFIVADELGRIALTPVLPVPADQTWFWSPEWQARIAEAEADRGDGRSAVYANEEDFLGALDGEADQSD